jgi:hypothetical protein
MLNAFVNVNIANNMLFVTVCYCFRIKLNYYTPNPYIAFPV